MRIIICLSILISIGIADEFIISYKAITKNNILFGEEFNISKALKKTNTYEIIGECKFINTYNKEYGDNIASNVNIIKILQNNKEDILNCLSKNINIHIRDDIKSINNTINSKTSFIIPPQRVIAVVDSDLIIINIIKSKT